MAAELADDDEHLSELEVSDRRVLGPRIPDALQPEPRTHGRPREASCRPRATSAGGASGDRADHRASVAPRPDDGRGDVVGGSDASPGANRVPEESYFTFTY